MAYTVIDDPSAFFQTVLYNGNAGTQSVVNDGGSDLQPDMVWIKCRSGTHATENHNLFDSVRGATKFAIPNGNTAGNSTDANSLTAFDSDGFSLGTRTDVNGSGAYVGWQWKAGTAFSNDASATSVGSIDSSGSISTTSGFSIVTWTGSGSAATIAHGLGAQPQIVFVKNREDAASWNVYDTINGGAKGMFLNENNGPDSDTSYFNSGTSSSTTFPVGTANTANGSSDGMMAYSFANVKGYSKIGRYIGNGNANGTCVFLGFKPAWLLIKPLATGSWRIWDSKREDYDGNHNQTTINGNEADAEYDDSSVQLDFISTGFKVRTSGSDLSGNGTTFLYMAFAEAPLVNSNKVPNNAE
tara:strand:+ start:263 stop:1330 length:1068 start_codon:yes stop_codon:yes gene_type:complete